MKTVLLVAALVLFATGITVLVPDAAAIYCNHENGTVCHTGATEVLGIPVSGDHCITVDGN
jgi:hypothetical protein